MRFHMRIQHPGIILIALFNTALVTLAGMSSTNSIIQGAGEAALLQAAMPITAVLNLACQIPASSGRITLEAIRTLPAIAALTAIALAGASRNPAGIAPELLAALAAGPAICGTHTAIMWMRRRRTG